MCFFDREPVPGPQEREARMFLGSTIWPLEESRVVSIRKTLVRS